MQLRNFHETITRSSSFETTTMFDRRLNGEMCFGAKKRCTTIGLAFIKSILASSRHDRICVRHAFLAPKSVHSRPMTRHHARITQLLRNARRNARRRRVLSIKLYASEYIAANILQRENDYIG